MPKARLFFDGDNSGIEKEARIYSLTQEVEDKLDSISDFQDEIDDLQDQINNLASRGRYLSTWNCVTGLPGTDPQVDPYVYRAGDYYIVSNVGGTNLRPSGAEYHVQVPSQVVESQSVSQNDLYIYDGIQWVLQQSGSSLYAVWGSITGTLSAQTDLQNALDAKANKTDVLEKTNTTSYTPTADYHPATKKYVDDGLSNKQATLVSGTNIKSINNNSLLGSGNLSIAEVPSGGTNGQVLTKTSQGPAWQNATGGADIEYKTQVEYNALLPGAASDGKHYFIYTSSTPSGWDMNNRALTQTSSALSGQWWGGVYFNPNGDKIYLTNAVEKKIYESDLDSPYDISNISFNKYMSTSIGPEDIHFSTDGTKVFIVSEIGYNCTVWQYDLSTAWDISSATLNNNTISGLNGYCRGLYISPDGLNVYVTIRNSNTFYKIPLATAWDISSAGATISGSSTVGGLSLWIGNNGTFAAGGGDETTSIITYGTLTTPYDLSSVTGVDTKEVGQTRAGGMWFNNEGTICVIVGGGSSTNYVTKYTL